VHFICSTFGSSGDVFPMMGLALELRSRGHAITFATNPHYAGLAAEYGLAFEPLGTEEAFRECISHPDLWHPQRAFRHIFRSLQPALQRQYEIHAERAGSDGVGITNCLGFGALVAQDRLGLPVITLHCQPAVIWSDKEPPSVPGVFGPRWLKGLLYRVGERFFIDPVGGPFLNDWRQELGLPPVKKITRWWNSPAGVLCMFPDWYAPPQADWPANVMQTDFPLWNHHPGERLAEEVEDFLSRGEPPVVFTPGSTNLHARPFFEAALQACGALGRRAILLTEYPDQLPQPLPESVALFRYVPLDLLLPRASVFVHHGGIGSTSQGMLAGVPQVLMPLAHDQFDNADRIRRLALGEGIPVKRFTGPRLAESLRRLLSSPAVAAACRSVAQRLAARDGLRRSAAAVEDLVAKGVGV
jgi:rhamnosyltransferase subunit B